MKAGGATLADVAIRSVNWRDYGLFDGPEVDFGAQLTAFVSDAEDANRRQLWQTMESRVFLQDDIAPAAEPAISVLLAALADPRSEPARIGILDLLFHLVQAASYREDELGRRCMNRAAEGAWLLVREARSGSTPVVEACLEILDICAPECAQVTRQADLG